MSGQNSNAPGFAGGYLLRSGRPDDAEQALRDAVSAIGQQSWIAQDLARCAELREEWAEAVSRWSAAEALYPQVREISYGAFLARLRLAENDASPHERDTSAARQLPAGTALPMRELMMQFESLGADPGGCEFGLVQRTFGAEPLGLLRWATIGAANLTDALNVGFEGVGDPANTELAVAAQGTREEYTVRDRRFGMLMHTLRIHRRGRLRSDVRPDMPAIGLSAP